METQTHHARLMRRGIIPTLILFVSLLPLLATAQLHDVRLRVLDPDGTPAANLMCALKAPGAADAAAFAFTDSTGATVLRVAATGHYGLSVLSFGKVLHEQEVDVAGAVDLGDITLRTATQQLDEVMVTAERRAVSNREGRLIFDVSSLPLKADYTAVDALVRTPLVNFSSDGVTIAGLGAEIRINGIRQQRAGGLYAYLSAIPIDRVERIEVHAGRSADLDASNSGGYVDIILRSLYGVSGFLRGGLSYYGMSYDARRRALLTESGGAGITYGKERWSAFADVYFGAGRSAGVKSRRETTFLS
ncbi:MAG: TonB-dependent receptor plug domain-containing protein, partial [Tannerella sp.]